MAKKLKIVIGTNTLNAIDQLAYSNHMQFWFRLGRGYPNIDFILGQPRRMSVDNMRNMMAKIAIESGADYLMFIDDDVLVPIDCLGRLLNCQADIAAGWTLIRGYPYKNMFFKFIDEAKTSLQNYDDFTLDDRGLIQCDAVGFSCVLLRVDLLKKIPPPFFVTGPYNTEDIYYCMKARKLFPETTIVVDPEVKTSHILGSELIDPLNRPYYKQYYETMYPEVKDLKEGNPIMNHEEDTGGITYEDVLRDAIWHDKDRITSAAPELLSK